MKLRFSVLFAACSSLPALGLAAVPDPRWADWIEPDFPFFSSIIDARRAGAGLPTDNVTPRGLVVNLGRDCWVGIDTDLLRVAAIWRGKGIGAIALAPGSYRDPSRKTSGGNFPAPEPIGKVWLANGIYPGWQAGDHPALKDPREPAPSPEEVGRGPLAETLGHFNAIRLVRGGGVVLDYRVDGTNVSEWLTLSDANGQPVIERHFQVAPSTRPLLLVLGFKRGDASCALSPGAAATLESENIPDGPGAKLWTVRVPAHGEPVAFCVALAESGSAPVVAPRSLPTTPANPRWPQEVTSQIKFSTAKEAYVVDDIALPLDNPWRRDVRLSDIQFLKDGTGVGVTIDGDVWLIRGLHEPGGTMRWRRFASGLHEPMSLAIRDEQIYVFDRNGIWRLRDTNGDGEADVHELFSNAFGQTISTREFPSTLRLAPDGEFVIAKGGQQSATEGKHNGSVLRISADGRKATVLGYGFRQPSIGVNVRTGLVTASDQQGQYVPSTPLYIVKDGNYHGFLGPRRPREIYPAPIADPLTWIPHTVDASAISFVWLFDARMGPLNDSLVHIGFNRPELFRVLLNNRSAKPQAAVVSITRGAFDDMPLLNGAVNPADGQLYAAGFGIRSGDWNPSPTRNAALARVRYTGAVCTLPREVTPMDKGVLVRFDVPLDPGTITALDNYSIATWHYVRTYHEGSPQLKADGKPGMDWLAASSAYLSKDRRSLFVGIAGMKPVMQMRFGWALATADGVKFEDNAYFTPYDLPRFDPVAEGFDALAVDLTPRAPVVKAATPVSVEEGRRLYQLFGCMACHSTDGELIFKLGPTWKGLYGRKRTFGNGVGSVVADEAYLRESILQPAAKIVPGFERSETVMAPYAGVLTDPQIDSLILFIKSLK